MIHPLKEFQIINKIAQSSQVIREDTRLGIGDDCAILSPPPHCEIAVTTDTLIENIHFPSSISAHELGYFSCAASLSDLAAMGAKPSWVMLSLSAPSIGESWLTDFINGYSNLLEHYSLQLIGGNLSNGPLAITWQCFGYLPRGQALLRSGANAGDKIFVTGDLGLSALAIDIITGQNTFTIETPETILKQFYYPIPKIELGMALLNIASAAIDISDGLLADLDHILERSGVGAEILAAQLPLSWALNNLEENSAYSLALTAGQSYELCFTIPLDKEAEFYKMIQRLNSSCTCIGRIIQAPQLKVIDKNGAPINFNRRGFQHWQES